MRSCHLMLIGLLVILLLPSAAAHAVGIELQTNPFERPVIEENGEADQKTPEKTAFPEMALRGTMAAGPYSLADIGGDILALGQEINGYTLIAVHQRHVVLQKNDTQMTLSIDKDREKKQ